MNCLDSAIGESELHFHRIEESEHRIGKSEQKLE